MYLTERQKEIASIIDKQIEFNGSSPTVREIAKIAKISPKAVQDHINALCAKGYYEKSSHKSRSLKWAEGTNKAKNKNYTTIFVKESITNDNMPLFDKEFRESNELIFLQNDNNENIVFDAYIIDNSSMQTYGIYKGDIAIINKSIKKDELKNGDIIAIQTSSSPFEIYKYSKDAIRIKLKNDSTKQLYMKDINLLGKLIEVRRRFK